MILKILQKVRNNLGNLLNPQQLKYVEQAICISLSGYEMKESGIETHDETNEDLVEAFISAKKIEGRSEKTLNYYTSVISKTLKSLRKPIPEIDTSDLRKFLSDYQETNDSSKVTIDSMRRILSSFFSWLEDEDLILKSPVRRIHKVKTGSSVKNTFTDEELEMMRDNCTNIRDLALLDILSSTGMRVGELVNLNISDVNLHERECIVHGKGDSQRIVYFDARAKIHLEEYINSRDNDSEALFVSLNHPHGRLSISAVETRIKKIGLSSDVAEAYPHKFRRTMATQAIDKGMPIEQVQKLLGHVRIDTTLHYALVNQSNVKMSHRRYMS